MLIPEVKRQKYTRARQFELPSIALNIYQKTEEKDIYTQVLGDLRPELIARLDAYRQLLAKALNLDKIVIYEKNTAKKALINVLNQIADALEEYKDNTVGFIIESGNDARESKAGSNRGGYMDLYPPIFTNFKSNGKRGQIEYAFKYAPGNEKLTVAGEFKVEDGEWIRGIYLERNRSGVIKGLPSLSEVYFRFHTIGPNNTVSDWDNKDGNMYPVL